MERQAERLVVSTHTDLIYRTFVLKHGDALEFIDENAQGSVIQRRFSDGSRCFYESFPNPQRRSATKFILNEYCNAGWILLFAGTYEQTIRELELREIAAQSLLRARNNRTSIRWCLTTVDNQRSKGTCYRTFVEKLKAGKYVMTMQPNFLFPEGFVERVQLT